MSFNRRTSRSLLLGWYYNWTWKYYYKRHFSLQALNSTAIQEKLKSLKSTRPSELVRDFIHDCLYNRQKGFFEGVATILTTTDQGFDFRNMKNRFAYLQAMQKMYEVGDQSVNSFNGFHPIWHTPSELFYPWYGQGIAEFMIRTKANNSSGANGTNNANETSHKLIIYEIGPGNGRLCQSIIEYYHQKYPTIARHMEYHLIEISTTLTRNRLQPLQQLYPHIISIHNHSFLEWKITEKRSVFLLFPEVFDNLAQDRIRYSDDGTLEQALVITNDAALPSDHQRKYTEVFVPATDELLLCTVNTLESIGHQWPSLNRRHRDYLKDLWPLSEFAFSRPWSSEFIPTVAFSFLEHLTRYFPAHHLLITDFDALPDCIPGHGSPVVQTRYKGRTIACSTYLLQRGLFDIFFAMDFNLLAKMYRRLHPFTRNVRILKHHEFCQKYMDVGRTATKSGYNPLTDDYSNVSFLLADTVYQ